MLVKRIAMYEPGVAVMVKSHVFSSLGDSLLYGETVFEQSAVVNRVSGGYSPAVAFADGGALAMSGGVRGNGVDLHPEPPHPVAPPSPNYYNNNIHNQGPRPEYPGCVFSVALTRSGRMLASGCDDGVVRLWRQHGGESIRSLAQLGRAPGGGVDGGYAPVTSVDFSFTGHLVAASYRSAIVG